MFDSLRLAEIFSYTCQLWCREGSAGEVIMFTQSKVPTCQGLRQNSCLHLGNAPLCKNRLPCKRGSQPSKVSDFQCHSPSGASRCRGFLCQRHFDEFNRMLPLPFFVP